MTMVRLVYSIDDLSVPMNHQKVIGALFNDIHYVIYSFMTLNSKLIWIGLHFLERSDW